MLRSKIFIYSLALAATFVSAAQASILTFDSCGTSASSAIATTCNGGAVNQNYGDRVTNGNTDANGSGSDRTYGESGEGYTPNVTVSYNTGFGWSTGFSNLTNVIWLDGSLGVLNITFQADAGFQARLLGFDLGAFLPNPTYQNVDVRITDELSNTLFSNTYSVGSNSVNQAINVTSGNGGFLTLTLDTSRLAYDPLNGIFDRESIGIDNIRFAQQSVEPEPPTNGELPEPSTFALVGGAALLGAWLRRR